MELPYHEPTEEFIEKVLESHLDEETGTPFWLNEIERREDLGSVNEVKEQIDDWDDLVDVLGLNSEEKSRRIEEAMRNNQYKNFVPQDKLDEIYIVGESGGTTGKPKRGAFGESVWRECINNFNRYLDELGFPRGKDMFWIGPPFPPHTIAVFAKDFAEARDGNILGIDLDPRIMKKFGREGMDESLERYKKHIATQMKNLLQTQEASYIFTTSKILMMIAKNMEASKLNIEGVIHAGAPLSKEDERVLKEEYFEGIPFAGIFGTGITGPTGLEDPNSDEVVYISTGPERRLEVYNENNEVADYGEEGKLATSKVSEYFLLPAFYEEDRAIKVETPEYIDVDLPCIKAPRPTKSRQEKEKGGVY